MTGTKFNFQSSVEVCSETPFTNSEERAGNNINLQNDLLRKMKPNKTNLYKHIEANQVLQNSFDLLYNELILAAHGEERVLSRALQLKITHDEALEKLKLQNS